MTDYTKAIEEFSEIELVEDTVKTCWWYADEGYEGYYQSEDPDDVPLLRFDIATWNNEDKQWVCLEDASYCTLMPIDTPRGILMLGLKALMSEFYSSALEGSVNRRLCEQYSWMSPEDFSERSDPTPRP